MMMYPDETDGKITWICEDEKNCGAACDSLGNEWNIYF